MTYDKISIRYGNMSAINLTKNLIQYSRSKYIEIRHHFIRDHIQNNDTILYFVSTNNQISHISTKPLREKKICLIRK